MRPSKKVFQTFFIEGNFFDERAKGAQPLGKKKAVTTVMEVTTPFQDWIYTLSIEGRKPVWKDDVKKRFSWAQMGRALEKVLYELVKAEEEEDAGIYLLMMHYDHASQTLPLNPVEKKKVLGLLETLIQDSRRHQRFLQEMIEKLEKEAGRQAKDEVEP